MKTIGRIALIISGVFMFTACQAFFTYSPVAGLQRGIDDLSDDQKISRAEDALATGDTEEMQEAYEEVVEMLAEDPDDTELLVLAAELAVGSSGAVDVVFDAIASGGDFDIDAALEGVDTEMLTDAADYVSAALDGGGTVSDETLVVAAAALVITVLEAGGDITDLETWDPESGTPLSSSVPELVEVSEFILAMDDTGEIIDIISDYFGS